MLYGSFLPKRISALSELKLKVPKVMVSLCSIFLNVAEFLNFSHFSALKL